MPEKYPEIMMIGEMAEYLRISLSSFYKLAQDGRVPCHKVGRRWRFRQQALDRWLEANPNVSHSINGKINAVENL